MTTPTSVVQAVDGVDNLFWDFTPSNLASLSAVNDFRHVWNTYIKGQQGEAQFYAFWRCWMEKFSTTTKQILIDYVAGRRPPQVALDPPTEEPDKLGVTDELLAIECVTLLFWDYTSEDIKVLRHHENFDHIWQTYIQHKDGEATFQALWRCWKLKLNVDTKLILIDYAVKRFGEEKRSNLLFGIWLKKKALSHQTSQGKE